ncbi:regulatory associated protein-mtor [Neofusicoccum parvum]|uniref:Regulatory associated protein-mtor n=2 Tax=Neofusicoccum parvum TaxID=310453 RepID=A0ACB5S433_9PEZI|nr:putative torc1 growth control complex subunit protein [Neofusicoccum parvum UCRNP2]GME27531.1 regulatory associated protein-mtor [Neofusicoccum parvum]GME64311.1 regulatory associated protein-mtor [Neofusicoccum parvum]
MTEPRVNGANGSAPGRPLMLRAKSDFGPRHNEQQVRDEDELESGDAEWTIRHGWESQLTSEEYQNLLSSTFFMYFTDKKHETNGNPKDDSETYPLQEWRMKDRLKTVSAVLALCLNIGVDPPDVIKTNPCAKLECWIDPTISTGTSGHTPMNNIGKALQTQYEQLSMRTRYKLCLDPTVDETRRYCTTLRKNARNERVLFHYNGHGVPRPTSSGEIWVFNRNYTQYIPISLYDLQSWLGAPSLFVYDCSDAGLIIQNFNKFAEKHEQEYVDSLRRDPNAEIHDFSDCIHLAACREKETLPTNPDLPADVFTSCLTTPIEMAVRFFILQNPLPTGITLQDAANIPGRVSERRTPIGELNWIFTAITDTIAWNSLSKPLFKKLFRQDLMVAALFRNFLLAQRIMRVYHCHPQCYPEIPETHDHPLWKSWDLAVEMILAQLPNLIAAERGEKQYEYQHSNFFAEQLTAFEVYLDQGGAMEQRVPEQLPIVLQVLLSQVHRLRALILLSKFLDLGPWAVNLALSIGIFPYVLKLLQSQAMELKPVMVFIWARILAVDQSCQTDLLKDNGYTYFISILNPNSGIPIGNQSEHRAMCAFIVAMFCKDFHQGQVVSLSPEVFESCLGHLGDLHNPLLRQWSCLCLSMLWVDYPEAKWTGIQVQAHQRLLFLRTDPVAEVRASMLHALTTFLGIPDVTPQVAQIEESIAGNLLFMAHDGNSMVRKELLVFFSTFVARYDNKFVVAAYKQLQEERDALRRAHNGGEEVNGDAQLMALRQSPQEGTESPGGLPQNTVFSAMWKDILILSVDPNPEVADNACVIVDYVLNAVLESPLAPYAQVLMDEIAQISAEAKKKAPRSSFFEWSAEYFREPQMKPTEADEPGSMDYNMRLWRRNRNDKMIAETQPLKEVAGSNRWDKPKGFFNNGSQPVKMCFHQFEEHLIVTDDSDTVCVWDWERQTRINRFSNGNPVGSKMTEVKFINEDDQALLMTGSSDGVIKLYRDYEDPNKVELVSAFRALTDLVPSNRYAGLVFDWQQGRGHILVAGDVRVIRVWNAGSETCTQDINARSGSCITSLTSDQVEGQVFAAGFGDGAVRIYDQRMEKKREMVKVWKEHKQWLTNVHLQRGGQRELVSACRDGEVKLWDIRMDRSVKTIQATRDTLRSLSVHEHAPVFAVGSERHVVKLFNLNSGRQLSSFEPYTGFLQNKRFTPISTTAFHPHRMMIAGSALQDSHINIYGCSGLSNYVEGDRE